MTTLGPLSRQTVHLCIDMQNLFDEGSPWCTPWMRRVLPVVRRVAERHAGRTIFTRFMPPTRPEELPGTWRHYYERWPQMTLERLEPGMVELLDPLRALVPPAVVVDKSFYSPFHETGLIDLLREREVDTLVMTGAETDVCVASAVLDAVDYGFRIVLVKDGCCSSSDATHDGLLELYSSRFSSQIEVADAETVLASWPD